MDVQRQAFESHFKTTEIYKRETQIRQKDILEFSSNFGYFNIITNNAWGMWQAAKANAVPSWGIIVPQLSANYLFNAVPELGFASQDLKDTVLYHLNYMASGFKESARKFVEDDHVKQKDELESLVAETARKCEAAFIKNKVSEDDYKQLYKYAIINSKKDKYKPNWAHVAGLGVSSGKAKEILRSFNIDPESTEMHKTIESQESNP